MGTDQDLTFLPQLAHGAVWNCIVWPGMHAAYYQWAPEHWFAYSASLETTDRMLGADWQHVGVWPSATDITVVRLWSQLADVRLVVRPGQTPSQPSGELAEAWARSTDVARAKASPVSLAWRAPDGTQPHVQHVADVLPPPEFGTVAFVENQRNGDSVRVFEAATFGNEVQAAQARLRAALRALANAPARQLAQSDPAAWLTQWEEARTMAQDLAAAYWHEANRRKLVNIPQAFDAAGMAAVPSMMPIQTILNAYSAAPAGGWAKDADGVPTYRQTTAQHDTAIQVRTDDPAELLDDSRIRALWQQVGELDDLDGDVFLSMLAQQMASTHETEPVWITAAQILEHRGIRPMMKRDEQGRERRAGHRQEDLLAVARCVGRQSSQWVTINSVIAEDVTGRRRKVRHTHVSKLTQIAEVVYQHDLALPAGPGTDSTALTPAPTMQAPILPIAWRYRMGTWLDPFLSGPNRKMAWLCKQALRYDPYHETWEKRLARYFVFHVRINAAGGAATIKRRIGTLLDELTLPVDERNPERTKRRCEQALDRLVADGVVDGWEYAKGNPALPARKWLATWRDWDVYVFASASATERYAEIAAHAETRRERAAALDAAAQKTQTAQKGRGRGEHGKGTKNN